MTKQGNLLSKTLVIVIIFLFVSITIQPAFAIIPKSSNDLILKNELDNNELVEYIIQIVRTDEIIEHKVLLTEEEVNNLESLCEKIRTDLNNSHSKEETTKIYNEGAESLKNFGIFPEDISISEIKQLMTGSSRNLYKIRFKNQMGNGFENRFCLVAGKTTITLSWGPIILFLMLYYIKALAFESFLVFIHKHFNVSKEILFKILLFRNLPLLPLLILSISSVLSIFPVSLGSIITLGNQNWLLPYGDEYNPAEGWIWTKGLNGKKSFNGSFYGQLGNIPFIFASFYRGITGFTGINIICKKTYKVFYLGFALHVKIDTSP